MGGRRPARVVTWLGVGLLVVALAGPMASFGAGPAPQPADWDIPNGHFFTQTGPGNGQGYSVVDDDEARFWSEFRRLGGVAVVGYPMSRRFTWGPYLCQVMQRGVFQWRPEVGEAWFVNVLDLMHDAGLDDLLFEKQLVPRPVGPDFDPPGRSWPETVAAHMALLTDADMVRVYNAAPDPMTLYGLPMSPVTDMGPAYVVRLQRAVMQKWKTAQPWAQAGQVTVANGGALAVDVGLVDRAVTAPIDAPAPPPAGAAPPSAPRAPTPPPATAARTAGAVVTVPPRPGASGPTAATTGTANLPVVNLTPSRGTATPPTTGATAAPVVGTVDPNVPVAGLAGGGAPTAAATRPVTTTAPAGTPTTAGRLPDTAAAAPSPATGGGGAAAAAAAPPAAQPTPAAQATPTLRPGGASGNAVAPSAGTRYQPFGQVRYESNCCNAWVEGYIYDAQGRPINGVVVRVTGRDGWRAVSRPTGYESSPQPDGLYRVALRSGADQLIDYAWTVQVLDADGQTAASDEVAFETDGTPGPDSRQLVRIDFKAR